jgi:hypothetical protein
MRESSETDRRKTSFDHKKLKTGIRKREKSVWRTRQIAGLSGQQLERLLDKSGSRNCAAQQSLAEREQLFVSLFGSRFC